MAEIRTARHDLRQHIRLIQSYLQKGDEKALSDYIHAYSQTLSLKSPRVYCANSAVNTILTYYGEEAEKSSVSFDCLAQLPDRLPMNEADFCVLLGNLLENALEASQGQKDSCIRTRIQLKDEQEIVLTLDNSPARPPVFANGQLRSTKHEGEGIGTLSVSGIAAKYNGLADFKWENGTFYASVLLKPAVKS